MGNRKWYEWMLTIVYIAMVALCVYLNFTPGHRESTASIIVNAVMFLIVGIVFLSADFGSFGPMNKIIKDLTFATEKIKSDAMNTRSYLWEPYQTGKVELFKTRLLKESFQDFIFELNRDTNAENAYYRPGIDDYINEDLVDTTMHRNEMNQVAGLMTGLGILGTFIGLSLGLQNFNTGTTAEMTNSIEPLMNGIKVAFHTSIYGMVFSLVFNAIYKKKLFEAENAVDTFINVFKKYVLPDTTNEGMNRLIHLQEKQLSTINNITSDLSADLAKVLEPHFERFHDIIIDFENMATRNQTEAMSQVVDSFLVGMNRSLGNAVQQISATIDAEYQVQQKNALMMNELLKATGSSTSNLHNINQETERMIATLNKYSDSIQAIQDEIRQTISALNISNASSRDIINREHDAMKETEKIVEGFREAVNALHQSSDESRAEMSKALADISDSMLLLRRAVDDIQNNASSTTGR